MVNSHWFDANIKGSLVEDDWQEYGEDPEGFGMKAS